MIFSFTHLPRRVKDFMLNHFVFTDIVSVLLTFIFLSSISRSITSVVGSIVCGLLVNITLTLSKDTGAEDSESLNTKAV